MEPGIESRLPGDAADAASPAAELRLVQGPGALRSLVSDVLRPAGARRVMLIASTSAVTRFALREVLHGLDVEIFSGFSPNPTVEQAQAACRVRDEVRPDAVVAVGGGSAIDTAKAARSLPADPDAFLRCLADPDLGTGVPRIPLIAVPTTAGTGSEVTRFATLYHGGRKKSFDRPEVRPDVALVDPETLRTCSPGVLHAAAFDALCHAVESHWSRNSTEESRLHSLAAAEALSGILFTGLDRADTGTLARLARAATTAGCAIDATRTTAAHAFAYRLTSHHGIPHGVACLLNLQWLWRYNREQADSLCTDVRGPSHVHAVLDDIAGVVEKHAQGLSPDAGFEALLQRSPYPSRLSSHGVVFDDLPVLIDAGLVGGRSDNNPVALERGKVLTYMAAVC